MNRAALTALLQARRAPLTRRRFAVWCSAIACGLALPSLTACAEHSGVAAGDGVATGDRYLFDDTYVSVSASASKEVVEEALGLASHFDEALSRTNDASDIGRLNAAGGAPVDVADDTARLLEAAIRFARDTDGFFDVTIGAVSSLWDFRAARKPDDARVREALGHVDIGNLTVQGSVARLDDPAAIIDLGGIAKGYIADKMVERLAARECSSALIDLGGNIYALGCKPSGDAWVVGVKDPLSPSGGLAAKLEVRDESVVTSGINERFFVQDGVTYHHVLDPRTGYPIETDLASATVVCPSSTVADVYATWALALGGRQAALRLGERGIDALLIDKSGAISCVGAMDERMR